MLERTRMFTFAASIEIRKRNIPIQTDPRRSVPYCQIDCQITPFWSHENTFHAGKRPSKLFQIHRIDGSIPSPRTICFSQ